MSLSDTAENLLIDFLFRRQPLGLAGSTGLGPASLYIALLTSAPDDFGAGDEVTGAGYERAPIECSLTAWSATQGGTSVSSGSSGKTANNVPIVFRAPAADWGVVVAYAVHDQPVGGKRLFASMLTAPRTIMAGDDGPQFPSGSLTFTLS